MSDNEHLLHVDELRALINIHDANDEEIYVRLAVIERNATAIFSNGIIKSYRNILRSSHEIFTPTE